MKISELFSNLNSAGISEVMLYLNDGSASRCTWRDTAVIGDIRVGLLGDQERGIVRIVPLDGCAGLGVPSPKGIDPNGYKALVNAKLTEFFGIKAEPESAGADADADASTAGEA